MLLFANPRERQQIKTLGQQMYPGDSSNFLKKFNKVTSKPFGKLTLDLPPNILEQDRFITGDDDDDDDDDNEKKVLSLDKSSSTPSMTQMHSQQLEQQKYAFKYHDPYGARAIKILCYKIQSVLGWSMELCLKNFYDRR